MRGEVSGIGGKSIDAYAEFGCFSGMSCAHSNIIGKNIYFEGHFSGAYSHIYSNNNTISAYFYGYLSGYNATLHCQSGDTCNIYCLGMGCFNLNLNCDGMCVQPNSCDDSSIICPNGYSSNSNTNSNHDFSSNDWIQTLTTALNYPTLLLTSDVLNDLKAEANYRGYANCDVLCDDYQECQSLAYNLNTNNYKICMTAQQGGISSTIELTGTDTTVVCDGTSSCVLANIKAGNVYAGANTAIDFATIDFQDIMVIGRVQTADDAIIKNGEHLVILSSLGCS